MKKFSENTRHIGRFLGAVTAIGAVMLTTVYHPLVSVSLLCGAGVVILLYALWTITE